MSKKSLNNPMFYDRHCELMKNEDITLLINMTDLMGCEETSVNFPEMQCKKPYDL